MNSEFRLFWVRGSEKGQSDLLTPDDNNIINFNGTFEAKCTIYISKIDGHARPKKLKIVLKRYIDAELAKIYGRLTIDIARYFGVKGFKRESIEMESGRSTAPVMNASFTLKQIGDSTTSDIDINEKSYFEEDDSRQPLADWDQTEQKDGEGKVLTPDEVQEQEQIRAEQVDKRKRRRKSSSQAKEELDTEDGEGKRSSGRKRRKISRQRKATDEEEENPETIPEGAEEEEEKSDHEAKAIDIVQILKRVLIREWDSMNQVVLDKQTSFQFPAAVFPIVASLFYTGLLSSDLVNDDVYASASDAFFREYEKAPLERRSTIHTRFITSLVLSLVLEKLAVVYPQIKDRTVQFNERLAGLVHQYATQIVSPFLMNFQVLCNRFATAKFEVDPLLDDFKQVLAGVWANMRFPGPVNVYLKELFMSFLDAHLLNKVISNPSRFMFSNAVVWNSFMTAFEGVQRLQFHNLRQSVCALVMAKNLTTPETSQEIISTLCPDLDKKLLVYFMKNYRPDPMMPEKIDAKWLMERLEVEDFVSYGTVKPREPPLDSVGAGLNILEWNNVVIPASTARAFPYFKKARKPGDDS